VIHHAQRIIANEITTALRHPWKIDAFDRKGNAAGMTSPFRLTANPPRKPPSLFIERFHWGITDPDDALGVPALAWLLREHAMLHAISAFTIPEQDAWREHLQGTALPFRRAANRHGSWKMRRSEATTNTAATVALAVAAAARVEAIPTSTYRDAFPIHLVTNVAGGAGLFA
jgi:hypothetical protein